MPQILGEGDVRNSVSEKLFLAGGTGEPRKLSAVDEPRQATRIRSRLTTSSITSADQIRDALLGIQGNPERVSIDNAIAMLQDPTKNTAARLFALRHLDRTVFNRGDSNDSKTQHANPGFIRLDNLRIALAHLGLPPNRVIAHWFSSHSNLDNHIQSVKRPGINGIFDRNFNAALSLEYADPHSVKKLSNDFGIHCFGRYMRPNWNSPLLTQQVEQMGDRTRRYGIYATPYENENASASYKLSILEDLQRQLGDDVLLRAYEFDGLNGDHGLVRTLFHAKSQYGPRGEDGHPASLGILGTHSSGKYLGLSWDQHNNLSTTHPVFQQREEEKNDISTIRKVFADDAVLILSGCHAGIEGGIAHHIANRFGITVIGPDSTRESALKKITVIHENNKLQFGVTYSKGAQTRLYPPFVPIADVYRNLT